MNRPESSVFEFDRFRVDSGRRRLTGIDGVPIPLTPRLFDTLLFMVEHPNVVLSKDELMHAIWPDTEVAENNLNQAVSSLRRALGESHGDPQFIITVPGHGYRFAATVREAGIPDDGTGALPSDRAEDAAPLGSVDSGRSWMAAVAGALVLIAAYIGVVQWSGRDAADASRPATPSPTRTGNLVALTWEEGAETQPRISPDGGSFLYVSLSAGNPDIYLRRVGGETSINLTKDSAAADYAPSYSPDGQTIAFRSERDGGGIFLMGATGESIRRLTDFGHEPAWSPDGRTLAVAAESSIAGSVTGTGGLWLVDVSTGASRKLWEGAVMHPSWSPSGARIAFDGWESEGGAYIFTIAATGGEPVRLMPSSSIGSAHSEWTSDGILFSTPAASTWNIFRARVDESSGAPMGKPEQITISTAGARRVSASRDGTRLLFQSGKGTRSITRRGFDPARGSLSGETQLVFDGTRNLGVERPSPDNLWLAGTLHENGQANIFLIRLDTGEARRLTDDPIYKQHVAWGPDSSRIFFTASPKDGNHEIWSVRIDGGGRERVIGVANESVIDPVLSPDGNSVYVLVGSRPHIVDLTQPADQRRPVALPSIDPDRHLINLKISPDGRRLLGLPFSSSSKALGETLFVYDIERKTYRELIRLEGRWTDWVMWWLPDSRRVLLYSRMGQRFEILDAETGSRTPGGLIEEGAWYSALSRDGQWIIESRTTNEIDIWMLDYRHPARQ